MSVSILAQGLALESFLSVSVSSAFDNGDPMRWWPAGAACPRQRLILYELLRFDTGKISMAPANICNDTKNDPIESEKITMAPANISIDTKNETIESEKIGMAPASISNDTKNELSNPRRLAWPLQALPTTLSTRPSNPRRLA